MSYILDALRKSDQQRQHGMAPTLASAPYSSHQTTAQGRPMWPMLLLSAIALLAAGAAIGWLRPWHAAQPQAPAPSLAATPAPVIQTPLAIEPAPPSTLPSPQPTPDQQPAETRVAHEEPQPAPVQNRPAPPKDDVGPPPKISMTVHAYSGDPADRLAGINGKMVREGEQVEPGLKLERITPDGVILNYRGRRLRHDMR